MIFFSYINTFKIYHHCTSITTDVPECTSEKVTVYKGTVAHFCSLVNGSIIINLLECPIPPPPLSSSVLVTKNPGHLKGGSRSLGKYRSSSSALSRSLQPANDEYENFGRIGDGEYVMVNKRW